MPHGLPPRGAGRGVVSRSESIPGEVVSYLNRLSDAMFVWSRWASHVTGAPETLWDPNHSASGSE